MDDEKLLSSWSLAASLVTNEFRLARFGKSSIIWMPVDLPPLYDPRLGMDHVLFDSEFSQFTLAETLAAFEELNFTQREEEESLSTSAERLDILRSRFFLRRLVALEGV